MKKSFFAFILVIAVLSIFGTQAVYAASSTIDFFPSTGSFGKEFAVSLVVDSHGDKFNAAQATVKISPQLAIKDLVLGDCNFSFLKTPSIQNPSFAGVILSKYSTKCVVYTLTLVPVSKGNASISLSQATVRQYGDAANILSSSHNASYILTAALKAPSVLDTKTIRSKDGLYTVLLKVSSGDKPVDNSRVILSPVSKKDQVKATSDSQGVANFSNIKSGIYSAVIEKDSNKIGETIINVSGSNHILTLGINIQAQKNNPLLKNTQSFFANITSSPLFVGMILVIGILLGIFIPKILGKINKNKK